ncbi:Zinc/iron permease [Podospora fimiseda]|uniref:Zinc/iron permease n=1 Tax=Podospora fimiseda TaxID=252190 RepID=A0AAN7H641_9PEZI|nr:Zinc/iron permease [Podospora fimiseda]
MADLGNEKPQCGSGAQEGEYDLPLHVAGLFMVLAASIIGAGFPVMAKKVKWLNVPQKAFFICKHFGTGVLIATAFVHLLPVAFASLTDPCLPDLFTDQYPALPGVIMMGSMFCLFVVEMWLNDKMGGHTHGGNFGNGDAKSAPAHQHNYAPPPAPRPAPRPAPMMQEEKQQINHQRAPSRPPRYTTYTEFETEDLDYEKQMARKMYDEKMQPYGPRAGQENPFDDSNEMGLRSEMPAWFVVFYEQYLKQRHEMVSMIKNAASYAQPANNDYYPDEKKGGRNSLLPGSDPSNPWADSPYIDVETGQGVDPMVYKKKAMDITLLEGGILFHSVFVGMTISITIDGFIILLVAILFHQMFEGLGLGSRIAQVPYKKGSIRPWVLVVAFGTTAPIGQAIGLLVRDTYDPNSAFGLIIVGIFNAISSGLLLYASLVDLLAEDFLSEEAQHTMTKKDRSQAFICVLAGAAGMSIVGAFA